MIIPVIWTIWVLIGLIVIWFQATWYIQKYGERYKDKFFSKLYTLFAAFFALLSLGLLWPLVCIASYFVSNYFKKDKSQYNPISWIHEKMIWLVRELQNPKENV